MTLIPYTSFQCHQPPHSPKIHIWGLHTLDVLAVQNQMQLFHIEVERIPEYINALEDAQKASKRAGNTVTNYTMVIIATDAMLVNVTFPRDNN